MKYQSIRTIFVSLLFLLTAQLSFAGAINGKAFKDWNGRCEVQDGKELCYIVQGYSQDGKNASMFAIVDLLQHKDHPVITIRLPNVVDVTKNLVLVVDKNQPIGLKGKCYENECRTAFVLDKRMLSEFKRGRRGTIIFAVKETGKEARLPISLLGFTKAINTLKKS